MFCSACGAKNADTARFCEACGTPVQQAGAADPIQSPIDPYLCTQCGTRNDTDARFCESCGATLGTDQPASVVPSLPAQAPLQAGPVVASPIESLPVSGTAAPTPLQAVPAPGPVSPAALRTVEATAQPSIPARKGGTGAVVLLLLAGIIVAGGFYGYRSLKNKGVFGLLESEVPTTTTLTVAAVPTAVNTAPAATPFPSPATNTPVPVSVEKSVATPLVTVAHTPAASPTANVAPEVKATPAAEATPVQSAKGTPAPGSPDRTQMIEALRTQVQQRYGRSVKFKVLQMTRENDMADVTVQSMQPGASDTAAVPFADIPILLGSFRNVNGEWRLTNWKPVGSSLPTASPTQTTPKTSGGKSFKLGRKSDGVLLSSSYPDSDLLVSLRVNYSEPGSVLDTIGLNAAPPGSFSITITGDGHVQFQVFAPSLKSSGAAGNGWHIVRSKSKLAAGTEQSVKVYVGQNSCSLAVNGKKEGELPLSLKLSGKPVYVGDFPGDESWGAKHNIHQAMTGTVSVDFFGHPIR